MSATPRTLSATSVKTCGAPSCIRILWQAGLLSHALAAASLKHSGRAPTAGLIASSACSTVPMPLQFGLWTRTGLEAAQSLSAGLPPEFSPGGSQQYVARTQRSSASVLGSSLRSAASIGKAPQVLHATTLPRRCPCPHHHSCTHHQQSWQSHRHQNHFHDAPLNHEISESLWLKTLSQTATHHCMGERFMSPPLAMRDTQ